MWKVGQLAKRTGVSVRTLHHYDQIGLLTPSHRTESGHRLYDRDDVARLQQIMSLRQLGLALDEIGNLLRRRGTTVQSVIAMHLGRMREQIELQRQLCTRLERIQAGLAARQDVSVDEFLNAIEEMTMYDKYFTPEQMEAIRKRGEALGPEPIKAAEAEWPKLIAEVTAEFEKGTPPTDPHVRELAKRWMALVNEFTGGDEGTRQSLSTMYKSEPGAAQKAGFDPLLFEYVRKAM